MIALSALWMPIVVSGVAVFIVSALLHMVLQYHRADYKQIPNEEEALAGLRKAALPPGYYHFPYCKTMKEMGTPEGIEKFRRGPVGGLTLYPNAPMNMGKTLGLWFVYCLVVSFFLAYIAAHTLVPGAVYLAVFRVVGAIAFLAYGFEPGRQLDLDGDALVEHRARGLRRAALRPGHRRLLRLALAALRGALLQGRSPGWGTRAGLKGRKSKLELALEGEGDPRESREREVGIPAQDLRHIGRTATESARQFRARDRLALHGEEDLFRNHENGALRPIDGIGLRLLPPLPEGLLHHGSFSSTSICNADLASLRNSAGERPRLARVAPSVVFWRCFTNP